MSKKRINVILVCGSGIATSTMVYPLVEDILNENGYSFNIIKGSFHDIKKHSNLDLILTTMVSLPKDVLEMNIPIVHVSTLLYGGKEEVSKEINKALGASV